jgi:Ca-activated chloride channel homolog
MKGAMKGSMTTWWMALAITVCAARLASADAGVLVPAGHQQPDSAIFSLDEMTIEIRVDNGDARVTIRQIFGSHTPQITEGSYSFALPTLGMVSDFAVWDELTRIPGVILERRRAEEIYENLKQQAIDPGLLEQGERDADEARRSNLFTAKIVPIPAFGNKRIEMEYHERLPVENLRSALAIALRPDVYREVTAGILRVSFDLQSAAALRDFRVASKAYALKIDERGAHHVRASFEGRNVPLSEDLSLEWELDPAAAGALSVLTYRDPSRSATGYFEASTLLANRQSNESPRLVVALLDTSLSMQWEKLERSYRALEGLLHALRPADRFGLLLFNSDVTAFSPQPLPATPDQVEKALAFVKQSNLRGGTDLDSALTKGLDLAAHGEGSPYLVLISDGGATIGTIQNARLAAKYSAAWKRLSGEHRPRTYVFGVGDDANLPLLNLLAENDGLSEWVRSTEPIDFKLAAFLSKLGKRPVDNLTLTTTPKEAVSLVYPLEDRFFPGSIASWIGQYNKPGEPATFAAAGATAQATLPVQSLDHPQLPRTWAKARVDALLAKIDREGEDRASIDEIIRLSREFKFVTPYTSFLAAPRSLLRPRVIRPGDPLIRVKTDPAIESVVALFPFGLTKPLRYLKEEDTWQTRFLAPADLSDGTYPVRLILRDRSGHVYRESKTFVIASHPPVIRTHLDKARYRAGEVIHLRVSASASARTIVARLYGAAPVDLRWNQQAGANIGEMNVPKLSPGKYQLTVIAEDVAHNIGSEEVAIEIVP